MTKELFTPLVVLVLGLSSSVARAQDATAVPDTQPPAEPIPGPPAASPPPPVVTAPALAAPAAPAGQWVYTDQYGWIWEPYGLPYTSVNENVAYTYAYYPAHGWRWLYSPWVIGFGPEPYWGVRGRARFSWYGAHGFRGGYHGGYVVHRAGPAYYRGARPAAGRAHWSGRQGFHGGGHGRR
jgi:hypothetical protein